MKVLLSYSQAGSGRKAKQGQEEISRNHGQILFLGSGTFLSSVWVHLIWQSGGRKKEQFVFGAVECGDRRVLGRQQDRDGQRMASLGKRGRRLSLPRGHDGGDRGGGITLVWL